MQKQPRFYPVRFIDTGPATGSALGGSVVSRALIKAENKELRSDESTHHALALPLPLAARFALGGAEVVIHDPMLCPHIRALIPNGAQIIEAPQSGANALFGLLLRQALSGQRVARLKSGGIAGLSHEDPEITAFSSRGLRFELMRHPASLNLTHAPALDAPQPPAPRPSSAPYESGVIIALERREQPAPYTHSDTLARRH